MFPIIHYWSLVAHPEFEKMTTIVRRNGWNYCKMVGFVGNEIAFPQRHVKIKLRILKVWTRNVLKNHSMLLARITKEIEWASIEWAIQWVPNRLRTDRFYFGTGLSPQKCMYIGSPSNLKIKCKIERFQKCIVFFTKLWNISLWQCSHWQWHQSPDRWIGNQTLVRRWKQG